FSSLIQRFHANHLRASLRASQRRARALHNRFFRRELPVQEQCRCAGVSSHRFTSSEVTIMRKIIFGSLLASTMLVPAFAQTNAPASSTPSAQPTPPATSSSSTIAPKAQGDMWRSSKLIGLNVYNDQNEKLGDISEILLDKSGKVDGVVIGVGGFLGMGKHDIKFEMSKLKFVDEPVRPPPIPPPTATTGSGLNAPANRPAAAPAAPTMKSKWSPDHAVLSGATKESLKSMPEFKYD